MEEKMMEKQREDNVECLLDGIESVLGRANHLTNRIEDYVDGGSESESKELREAPTSLLGRLRSIKRQAESIEEIAHNTLSNLTEEVEISMTKKGKGKRKG